MLSACHHRTPAKSRSPCSVSRDLRSGARPSLQRFFPGELGVRLVPTLPEALPQFFAWRLEAGHVARLDGIVVRRVPGGTVSLPNLFLVPFGVRKRLRFPSLFV